MDWTLFCAVDIKDYIHEFREFQKQKKKLNNRNPNTYYKNSTETSATGLRYNFVLSFLPLFHSHYDTP